MWNMSLKGMAHAGFFSGTVIYFSLWYCKKQLTLRFAILSVAVSAAGVISSTVRTGAFRKKSTLSWTYRIDCSYLSRHMPLDIWMVSEVVPIGDGCFYLKACRWFHSVSSLIFFLGMYLKVFSVRVVKVENILNCFEN